MIGIDSRDGAGGSGGSSAADRSRSKSVNFLKEANRLKKQGKQNLPSLKSVKDTEL
jgi:hypothetical protein